MGTKLSPSTKFRKAKKVQWKEVEGEAVLFHGQSGDYFTLDAVGTSLWKQVVSGPRTLDDLIVGLSSEYAEDESKIRCDVLALCGQLVAEDLLVMEEQN